MRTIMATFVTLMLLTMTVQPLVGQPGPNDPARQRDLRKFMRVKLEVAKQILEGITREDFGLIQKNAERLSTLSNSEYWQVYQTPEYGRLTTDFRAAAAALAKAGRSKNAEAATLDYMKVVLQCVECHKYVRSVRIADHRTTLPLLSQSDLLRVHAPDDSSVVAGGQ